MLVVDNEQPCQYPTKQTGSNASNLLTIKTDSRAIPAKLALINARSVRNKADIIVDYVVEHDFDIVCITETWLSGNDAASIAAITPDGYDFRHLPRPNRRGGGVSILFKTSFHLCSVTPLPAKTFEGIEVVLRVRPTSTVRIVTIYRPPSSGKNTTLFSEFISEFSRVLDRAATRPTEYVIVGDFNVHYGDQLRPDVRDLSELLKDNEFKQHVTEPTHVGGNILDLVITRDTPDNTIAGVSVDTLLSDHNIVQCNLLLVKPRRPRQKITYRKYAAINNVEFLSDLEQSTLFTNPSDQIAGLSRQYNSTITELIDKHAPLITRVITIRQKTPWFSEGLSEAKRQLRRAERRWRQSRLTVHRDMFTSLRDMYRHELITTKSAYVCDKIQESTRNMKSMYRVANDLMGRKQSRILPEHHCFCFCFCPLLHPSMCEAYCRWGEVDWAESTTGYTFTPCVGYFTSPGIDTR